MESYGVLPSLAVNGVRGVETVSVEPMGMVKVPDESRCGVRKEVGLIASHMAKMRSTLVW